MPASSSGLEALKKSLGLARGETILKALESQACLNSASPAVVVKANLCDSVR